MDILITFVLTAPTFFAVGVYRKEIYDAYVEWRAKREMKAKP